VRERERERGEREREREREAAGDKARYPEREVGEGVEARNESESEPEGGR